MGGVINHVQPEGLAGWMRQTERRMLTQERRSTTFQLNQALGPGAGKFSTRIFDWNNEKTWFNGTYWSDTGSYNSPDGDRRWLVTSQADSGLGGFQEAVSFDAERLRKTRFFTFATREIPTFEPWYGDTEWTSASLLGDFAPFGGGFPAPAYRIKGDSVECRGVASYSGPNPYGLVVFNLPPDFHPPFRVVKGGDSGAGHSRVDVTTAGDVLIILSTAGLGYQSFDDLTFPIR